MKPIMLATDGSPTAEHATATAIELAKALGTDLVVVTVWEIPYTTVGLAPAPVTGELAQLGEEDARKVAAGAAARAEEAGVETRTVILRGITVQELCTAAQTFDPRFLVIGSHGWGIVRRTLFGSVSTGVLHHAHCPVLVVRGEDAAVKNGTGAAEKIRA
ncbi:MAG TPA: universal stress protein [Gaiellaceae bacterium]|nr:universal stress protein [Gaiellaceae bacterium]